MKRLHYQFDGWLGDTLITANTAAALQCANLSGFQCASVEISRSEQFIELNGDKQLPAFQWLKIDGVAGNQDFGISKKGLLIANGPVIKDGDTIGEDGDERIRVVYSKSSFGHEGQVMRLHYEKPSQKKGLWSRLWK